MLKVTRFAFAFCFLSFQLLQARPLLAEAQTQTKEENSTSSLAEKVSEVFGISYLSFFNGPGILPDRLSYCPNQLGMPDNDGLNMQNNVSVKYKFSSRFALDLQTRFKFIFNNYTENEDFSVFRWETPRIGVSGKLLSGQDWSLNGAINTDFPYFFPSPLSGYQAQQRTTIVDPGLFASFRYEPLDSPWSFFSIVTPRFYVYVDRAAAEPQLLRSGFAGGNKPELVLSFTPTVNYKLSPRLALSAGFSIDYRKLVVSDWNPFEASLVSNGNSAAWRLNAIPISLGVTYKVSSYLTVFPYLAAFPIAIQRTDARTGAQATFLETVSAGMWLSGTLF